MFLDETTSKPVQGSKRHSSIGSHEVRILMLFTFWCITIHFLSEVLIQSVCSCVLCFFLDFHIYSTPMSEVSLQSSVLVGQSHKRSVK